MKSRIVIIAGVLTAAPSLAPRADACDSLPCQPGSVAPFAETMPVNAPRLEVVAGIENSGDGRGPHLGVPEPGVNVTLTSGDTVVEVAVERQGDTRRFTVEPLEPLEEGSAYELTYT